LANLLTKLLRYIDQSTEPRSLEGEDEHVREAREQVELLQGLRVVLPGVQVLFAFLLTVAFTQQFEELALLNKYVYYATLLCTTLSAALLMAPSVHHRFLWRQGMRERRLIISNILSLAGLLFLVPGMVGVIFVITDLLFSLLVASLVTAVFTISFVLLWFILPILYSNHE
jgi:hypothetical protein